MKLKKILIFSTILCSLFIIIFFVNVNRTHADSIRPIVNGNYDSYVTNQQYNNDGYTDSDDVNNPGATVHVQNANQLLDYVGYVKGGGAVSKSSNNPVSKIHKIILDNDISLSDATDYPGFAKNYDYNHPANGDFGTWILVNHKNLVIDGQGHTLDMMYNCFATAVTLSGNQWTLENMKIYGSSYWGPLSTNSSFTINYRNIDYYGSQLIWSSRISGVKVNVYGNVACHSLLTYKPLKGQGYLVPKGTAGSSSNLMGYVCETNGNQQNMQVGDITFHNGSKYFGESYNGTCLELAGGAKLDDNAQVELHPHGDSGELAPGSYGSVGLYLNYDYGQGYKSQISFKSNDLMNIYCDSDDIYNSDGSHYKPKNPDVLSAGFYASSQTDARLDNGQNSVLRVFGKGAPRSNNPLVNIQSMNAVVSGKGNAFIINSDANNTYVPSNGLMNTSNSNISVKNGGSFIMNVKEIPDTNIDNYLLQSPGSYIDIDRPGKVVLSNDDYRESQSNHLNWMTSGLSSALTGHNLIHIRNSSVDAKTYGINYLNKILDLNNVLSKDIILPLDGSKLFVAGIRLMGSYFDMIQYANGVNNTLSNDGSLPVARNFNTVTIKGTPIPQISKLVHNNVNTHNRNISGQVTDENNNPIANSYIKLKTIDKNSFFGAKDNYDDNFNFYKSNDNFKKYINSHEIIYSVLRQYAPDSLGNVSGSIIDTSQKPNFFSSIAGGKVSGLDYPQINPSISNKYFGYANQYFMSNYDEGAYRQFNIGTTTYNGMGFPINNNPYMTTTDDDGNFSFDVPQKAFNDIQNDKNKIYHLDLVPSYNFTDGPSKSVSISYNPLISVKNTLKNITYSDSNSNDGLTLNNVFKGGQGRAKKGDTLEFDNEIYNDASNSDVPDATFTQPLPYNVDLNTLKVSYDNGKTFSSLNNDNYIKSDNENGIRKITLKNINLKSGQKYSIIIQGTMYNDNYYVDNNSITINPEINYNGTSINGNDNQINFTDNQLKFKPNDIYFGDSKIIKNQFISPTNNNQPIITDFQDDRRDKTMANIYVQQESDKFYNDNDSSQKFSGNLILNGRELSFPTLMFSTDNTDPLYLNRNSSLYLLPNEDFNSPGSYSTKLDWTVNYGIN